uniref:Uncharacterized protein n=1 Tax=Sphaerodactylus townsendi TaxID=933632 RepID=A0ACB8FG37_9SAUR
MNRAGNLNWKIPKRFCGFGLPASIYLPVADDLPASFMPFFYIIHIYILMSLRYMLFVSHGHIDTVDAHSGKVEMRNQNQHENAKSGTGEAPVFNNSVCIQEEEEFGFISPLSLL